MYSLAETMRRLRMKNAQNVPKIWGPLVWFTYSGVSWGMVTWRWWEVEGTTGVRDRERFSIEICDRPLPTNT